ncbi:MAG: regulatory signaling modulator protein AmpE [Gammaproteobacteria bacterium]
MILISLLVVLFLEYQFKLSSVLGNRLGARALMPAWYEFFSPQLRDSSPRISYLILVSLPVILAVWLTQMDGDFFLGVAQFFLTILILSYSLGPLDQNAHLKSYFEALERDDLQAAFIVVQENLNQKQHKDCPESSEALGRQVTDLILRQCNFRFFGVLFYYVLFGVGGALAYNLICNIEYHVRDEEESTIHPVAKVVRTWIDWIPQRLTALLYSLAGDFNGAFARFLPFALKSGSQSDGMLEQTGIGAMGLDFDNRELDIITENREALALVSRATKVLILIIAIMTVFGLLT